VLLHFVQPPSVSFDPRDIIQAPEPCDVIEALDPFAQLLLRSTLPTITHYHGTHRPLPFPAEEHELAMSCKIAWELVTPDS
jgi:hypothetical protein